MNNLKNYDEVTDDVITTEPLPGSKKIYVQGEIHPYIKVPMRQIELTNGESIVVYDTSGVYTDPDVKIDVRKGIEPIRKEWITSRGDVECYEGRIVDPKDNGY